MNEEATSIAEDAKTPVEQNITASEYAARRLSVKQAPAIKPEAKPNVTEEKPEEKAESAPEKAPEEAKTEGKEVLSHVDLSELSDEDIAELAQKGKSGLLKRIAELTAKRKMAEEKAAQMEAYFQQQQAAKPLEAKVENNPFKSIASVEDLSKKAQEIAEVVEWAEEVLDKADHLGYQDIVAVVDGKELTKEQVKDHLRSARKAQTKYLPAQYKELQVKEQRKAVRSLAEKKATEEIEWLKSQEDNDGKRLYQSFMSDERLKALEDVAPDIAAQLPYYMAHAANSIYGRRSIPLETKPSPKLTPPSNPGSSAAPAPRADAPENKALRERSKALADSGSVSDFIALRTSQLSKRKSQ